MYNKELIEYESEKIELYFSCRNLPNLDFFSKTDAKVSLFKKVKGNWEKLGETEVIWDSLNPDFSTTIIVDYYFEMQQYFKVEVIDIDDANDHSNFDFCGYHEFELSKIVGNNKAYYSPLKDYKNKDRGYIIIRYDKVCKNQKIYNFDIHCSKIKNKRCLFWKSNPFIKLYKYKGNIQIDDRYDSIAKNQWILTYQSKRAKKNLNPKFNDIKISSSKICSNNKDLPLKLEVWDYHSNGSHKLIGYQFFRLSELNGNSLSFNIFSKSDRSKKYGNIRIINFYEEDDYDIIDYIRSGLQIQVCIAIDFTASNRSPCDPKSLHYLDSNNLNLYQKAIFETSNILLNYDHDKKIPLFGFGFKLPNNNILKNVFPLSFDWNNTEVNGIDEIMNCYKNSLNSIIFSGPTYFSPIIKTIVDIIKNSFYGPNDYFVLSILTDGLIHDMQETIDTIVEASDLPFSIIIIGIGDEDFENMEILDGDDIPLVSSLGVKTKRDLVQFVPFKKFGYDQILLTKEVLFEIPTQIKDYFKLKNLKPGLDRYNNKTYLT